MSEVSKEIKKAIVENEITAVNQGIYTWVIRRRVADRVDDKAGKEAAEKQLEVLEKKLDAYREELKSIDKE